jgi:hypothetical protein
MITEDAPTVFIVDDDANVRRSIQDITSCAREIFARPREGFTIALSQLTESRTYDWHSACPSGRLPIASTAEVIRTVDVPGDMPLLWVLRDRAAIKQAAGTGLISRIGA